MVIRNVSLHIFSILLFFYREKAVLAVTLCNDREEILGHAAFFDYPNTDVDSATWETWFQETYGDQPSNALNSLFMHYFVAKPEYAHGCAREIIRTAFNAVPDLHFLFLLVPMGAYPGKQAMHLNYFSSPWILYCIYSFRTLVYNVSFIWSLDSSLDEIFKQMDKKEGSSGASKGAVFVCHRHNHVPVLHVRKARFVPVPHKNWNMVN